MGGPSVKVPPRGGKPPPPEQGKKYILHYSGKQKDKQETLYFPTTTNASPTEKKKGVKMGYENPIRQRSNEKSPTGKEKMVRPARTLVLAKKKRPNSSAGGKDLSRSKGRGGQV